MKYFLCGNTGSINRGCEAIVRSTVKVLDRRSGDIFLATFAPEQDRTMASQLGINVVKYDGYPTSVHRYAFGAVRKIFSRSLIGYDIIEAPLFSRIEKDYVCLNIGGDTYCYKRPVISLALNKFTHKKGVKNILWCCSVEKSSINKEIYKDLSSYSYIFAREQITLNNLIEAGIDERKIVRVCDPAFFLNTAKVDLPNGFVKGNTVGINVSEMVINEDNHFVYSNVVSMVRYILDNTDMSVCFIPHVYSIKNNTNDYPILKKLYEEFECERVSMVDRELNCEELKYIISNCRFFIGARTHSTIAAYSSEVPTLVLGYSVKSKGIATDLFGTYKDYVLPYGELTENNELLAAFVKIVENETVIRQRLADVLPNYKKQLTDAMEKYVLCNQNEPFSICESEICTGCGACALRCPKECITMSADSEGFLRPAVDTSKCISCGICKSICPVANRPKDDGKVPHTYAAINNSEEIRLASSSGGVFTALAESVIKNGGVVFGASLDSNMKVVHKRCSTIEELTLIRGSKYVQSDAGDTYKQAEALLKEGVTVLYTGTPCQIGGLYAYLGKDYDNLYTQDLICHGAPSPAVWQKYIDEQQKKFGSKATVVSFRNKMSGWKKYSLSIEFENGADYIQPLANDVYMRGFLSHMYLRPSCSMCAFKQYHRQSDITLADFWGIEKTDYPHNDDKGVSAIMVHSEKGTRLIKLISDAVELERSDFEKVIAENSSYYKSTQNSKFRIGFFNELNKSDVSTAVNKYYGNSIFAKARRAVAKFIP